MGPVVEVECLQTHHGAIRTIAYRGGKVWQVRGCCAVHLDDAQICHQPGTRCRRSELIERHIGAGCRELALYGQDAGRRLNERSGPEHHVRHAGAVQGFGRHVQLRNRAVAQDAQARGARLAVDVQLA